MCAGIVQAGDSGGHAGPLGPLHRLHLRPRRIYRCLFLALHLGEFLGSHTSLDQQSAVVG